MNHVSIRKERSISQRLSRNKKVTDAKSKAAANLTKVLDRSPTKEGCNANSRNAKWSNNNVLPKTSKAKRINTHQLALLPNINQFFIRSLIL
jgi:hypothetical protein